MPTDDQLRRLLGEAADLSVEPTADVAGIIARARQHRRQRRALLVGVVGLVALVGGVAVAASDPGDPDDLSTVDAPERPPRDDGPHETAGDAERDPTTTTTSQPVSSTTTTTTEPDLSAEGQDPTSTGSPGSLRLVVAGSTVASYAPVATRSADPCPAGTLWVEVEILGVGGSMDGRGVGGDQLQPDAAGHWSVQAGIAAVGHIENVAWAMTADQLDVAATCRGADQRLLGVYEPVRVRLAAVPVVPVLTAAWDGATVQIEYAGCPTSHQAVLSWGVEPPAQGIAFPEPYVTRRPRAGSEAGTWVATVAVPDRAPGEGLWATAFCEEPSGVTSIWRYQAVELDAPG